MEPGTEMVAVGRGRGAKSESECAGPIPFRPWISLKGVCAFISLSALERY